MASAPAQSLIFQAPKTKQYMVVHNPDAPRFQDRLATTMSGDGLVVLEKHQLHKILRFATGNDGWERVPFDQAPEPVRQIALNG